MGVQAVVKDAPGAAPKLQGYWCRVWGEERKPPTWHKGHLDPEWIEKWLAGWDEADEHKRRIYERNNQEN